MGVFDVVDLGEHYEGVDVVALDLEGFLDFELGNVNVLSQVGGYFGDVGAAGFLDYVVDDGMEVAGRVEEHVGEDSLHKSLVSFVF